MNKQFPFISINEFNLSKVKSSFLRSLTCENCCGMNKQTLLHRYNDLYGIMLTESQALFLAKNICEYNGLIFIREKWTELYQKWISSNKSFSIHFF